MNNNNLKSTTLPPQDNLKNDRRTSTQSLTLISLPERVDRPAKPQSSIARIYVEQAKLYFQEQNWRMAIDACKNAIESDPKIVEAYKILGNILKLKGRKADALGVYARALAIDPNCAAIYANLGSFYAEQQNWQLALEHYQQAVILDPNLAGAYRSLAQVWEELGDSVRALECFCQAVNLEPEVLTSEEYFNFGKELYKQGKVKEASIFYTQGVKLNPKAKSELARLVKMLEELKEWQQAVMYYHQLISLDDSHLPKAENPKPIAKLLARSKRKSKKSLHSSASDRVKAISTSSNSVPRLLPNSSHLKKSKKAPQASLGETAGVTNASSEVSLTIVKDSFKESQTPTVEDASQNSRQPTASSLNNLGSLYAQKRQWLKAISCYQEALELDPKSAKIYRNLARVYHNTDRAKKAYLCCYTAYNLEPKKVTATEYFDLARHLLQQNETNKAIACLQRTVELQSDFKRAYLILGKLFEKAGKIEQAKSYYSKLNSN